MAEGKGEKREERVLLLDGVVERFPPIIFVGVDGEEVLVSDLDVLGVGERLGVTVLGSKLASGSGDVANGVLDLLERSLDVRLEIRFGDGLSAERVAGVWKRAEKA